MSGANRRRDNLFITEPPPAMRNPVGRWYCVECECLATDCKDLFQHTWQVLWEEAAR